MSQLCIYPEDAPDQVLLETQDADQIQQALAAVGVAFRRWPLHAVTESEQVLAAYAAEIADLQAEGGYQAVDVVAMTPDHPQRAVFRQKFLSEHTHSEDEVRFFVQGAGLFVLHLLDKVYAITCEAGDLINVPAGTKHWFDMGASPSFTAVRLFTNPEGWVAQFTGDEIAELFPKYVV